MTEPLPQTSDNTSTDAPRPSGLEEPGVRGGDAADRMDSAGPGSGGMPGAGADGETGAREQLRKDLGERSPDMGTEAGGDWSRPLRSARPTTRRAGRSRSTAADRRSRAVGGRLTR
jgi:hypothetical protein